MRHNEKAGWYKPAFCFFIRFILGSSIFFSLLHLYCIVDSQANKGKVQRINGGYFALFDELRLIGYNVLEKERKPFLLMRRNKGEKYGKEIIELNRQHLLR